MNCPSDYGEDVIKGLQDGITKACELYGKLDNWKKSYEVISEYFNNNRLNVNEDTVLTKVVLVDRLYHTNIWYPTDIAEQICQQGDWDEKLEQANIGLVETAEFKDGWGKRKLISFASKYCHFHKRDVFPIYDKYAVVAIKHLLNGPLNEYKQFKGMRFKDLETLDRYLWLSGHAIEYERVLHDTGDEDSVSMNRRIKELFKADCGNTPKRELHLNWGT